MNMFIDFYEHLVYVGTLLWPRFIWKCYRNYRYEI